MKKEDAEALAERITAYWAERGCEGVTVVPERTEYDPALRAVRYELRSNLVNGKCPYCVGKAVAVPETA